jgi:hypothetical protein
MRTLLSVLLVVGGVFTIGFWLPFGMFASVVYLVYFAVRALVLGLVAGHHEANRRDQLRAQQPPPLPAASLDAAPRTVQPELAQTHAFRKPWARPKKQLRPRAELIGTPRERARDLVGSLLLAPLVIGVLYLLFMLVTQPQLYVDDWGRVVWAASLTLLGTWAALVLGKIWESHPGEAILRRFTMLVVGLGLGGAAWLLAGWLGLLFSNDKEWRNLSFWDNAANYQRPYESMLLSIASFGITFALIAWWHQCDPLRTKRFSFIMFGLSLLMAFITHIFLPFMQPWGLLIVGVMSVTLQLTSRWIPHEQRQKIEVS